MTKALNFMTYIFQIFGVVSRHLNCKERYLALPLEDCAVAGSEHKVYDFLEIGVAAGFAHLCTVGRAFWCEPLFNFSGSYTAFFGECLGSDAHGEASFAEEVGDVDAVPREQWIVSVSKELLFCRFHFIQSFLKRSKAFR